MLNKSTNLHIVPRKNEKHRINFVHHDERCSSWVGQAWWNEQDVNISDWCKVGSIGHEILHAAGFFHTQSRADRDKHIKIKWDNIKLLSQSNYWMHDWISISVGPYNTRSMMHYGSFATNHAKNPKKPVITLKNGKTFKANRPTSAAHMLKDDIRAINQIYQVDEPAETSSRLTVCLQYKGGKMLKPGLNLNRLTATGTSCNRTNRFILEDLNGGDLKNGDIVHIRSTYNRYLSSIPSISTVLGSSMTRSNWTQFKVNKVVPSDSRIRTRDKISITNHSKQYLVGAGKNAVLTARKSAKTGDRTFTIRIMKKKMPSSRRHPPENAFEAIGEAGVNGESVQPATTPRDTSSGSSAMWATLKMIPL